MSSRVAAITCSYTYTQKERKILCKLCMFLYFFAEEKQTKPAIVSKWSDKPTLLEKQRETSMARLRKEFGLSVPDDKNGTDSITDFGK